jgi:hypothetical protein
MPKINRRILGLEFATHTKGLRTWANRLAQG